MANWFVRSRPTANWSTGVKTLGTKVVGTSATQFLGICFEVTTGGTSSGSEPAWNTTVGGTTTDSGGVVWTTRGAAGIWQASKVYVAGDRVCKVSQSTFTNASSCVWLCTTGGTSNSTEPTWPTTLTSGTTTQTDNTVTWTCEGCSSWDNANPFIAALLADHSNVTTSVGPGDTIYVSNGHAENTASASFGYIDIFFARGTKGSPNSVLCVSDTGQPSSPTTLATTATVTESGSSYGELLIYGYAYIYGITFITTGTSGNCSILLGEPTSGGAPSALYFDACSFQVANSLNTGIYLNYPSGNGGSKIIWNNTTTVFNNTANCLFRGTGEFLWRNTTNAISGSALPAFLVNSNTGTLVDGNFIIDGVDLSGLGANTLFSIYEYIGTGPIKVVNSKISSSTTLWAPSVGNSGFGSPIVDFINCDFSATNYKFTRNHGSGTISQETTKIMTGGATDGVTGISWNMGTNANSTKFFPLESLPLTTYNTLTGSSHTATVQLVSSGALNTNDIWIEVEYLGSASTPISSFATSFPGFLASNTALTTSSSSWTTTGISSPTTQQIAVTFTPQLAGPVNVVVKLAKPSISVYVNPVIAIT